MRFWQVVALCAGGLVVVGAIAVQLVSPRDAGREGSDILSLGRTGGIAPDSELTAEGPLPSLPLGAPRPPSERSERPLSVVPESRPASASSSRSAPAKAREARTSEAPPTGPPAGGPPASPPPLGTVERRPQPLYLTAIVGRGARARALLVNRETGESTWVHANEEAFGLRLLALDRGRAVLEGGEGTVTLALGVGAPAAKPTATPPAPGGPQTEANPPDKLPSGDMKAPEGAVVVSDESFESE